MTPNKNKKKVVKKHRHRWESVIWDCGLCGGGSGYECECGDMRTIEELPKRGKKK